MKPIHAGVLVLALLAGCSERAEEVSASVETLNVAQAPAADAAGKGGTAEIPVSVPKIAYSYTYGFRISGREIPALQRLHADHCEKLGPKQCRVISLCQDGAEGDYAHGSLNLEVAAPRARAFGGELAGIADKSGAEAVSSSIAGEDLSKQIVDTEARLRARIVLRDRLMEVLTSRKGSVAELVEAERGVAQVNEEIDQARSWLAEMNGRVDFSKVEISYNAQNPSGGGFLSPIRAVLGNLGVILGSVIAAIIALGAVLVPLGMVFWGLRRLWRRLRSRKVSATEEG